MTPPRQIYQDGRYVDVALVEELGWVQHLGKHACVVHSDRRLTVTYNGWHWVEAKRQPEPRQPVVEQLALL